MKRITEKMISAAIREDSEITREQARKALAVLRGTSPQTSLTDEPIDQLLVTTAEAARLLAVSRQTLWRLEKQGVLSAVTLGPSDGLRIKRYNVAELKRAAAGAKDRDKKPCTNRAQDH